MSDRLGVLLMTYGSPSDSADVDRYLRAVRGGREPDPELLVEFRRRYEVIGGSPLIPLTMRQAAGLEAALGDGTRVLAAMRFSEPSIATALAALMVDNDAEQAGHVIDAHALFGICDTRRRGGQLLRPIGKIGRGRRVFQG